MVAYHTAILAHFNVGGPALCRFVSDSIAFEAQFLGAVLGQVVLATKDAQF